MSESEEINQEEDRYDEEYDDESTESEVCYDTYLAPTDTEKKNILAFALELRNESTFCDVAFLVKGSLFRAHRVIVGSWSRWLRAVLSDGPEEEVVCLDMFTPEAFGNILDYMYGKPFQFGVATAENYLKVLRRLEMQHLEQQCWQFLISVIDTSNCEKLHELADVFDCPPLKLCAWKIVQESMPGYATAPSEVVHGEEEDGEVTYQMQGNGLTGPCDIDYDYNVEDEEDEEQERLPALFERMEEHRRRRMDGQEDEEEVGEDGSTLTVPGGRPPPPHPKSLPKTATAAERVRAWAVHLEYIYKLCHAPSGTKPVKPIRIWGQPSYRRSRGGRRSRRKTESSRGEDTKSVGSIALQSPVKVAASPGGVFSMFSVKSPSKLAQQQEENKVISPKDTVDWRTELTGFYTGVKLENKISDLDNILASWQGREDLMLESLIKKYKASIPPTLDAHLHKLLRYIHGQSMQEDGIPEESSEYYDN